MISVIMGVHVVDDYLLNAINSILHQSFSEIELLVVANGKDCHIIEQYINSNIKDDRLVILKSKIPQLAYSLNLAIDNAKYKYIARMDSDDISYPDRLRRQLNYLLENNLDMVGSNVRLIDESGNSIGSRIAPKGRAINKKIPFGSTFIHPSCMYKKDLIIKARGYNSGFNSEDYDLWLRLKRLNISWDNMNEILLDYRIHTKASQRALIGYAESAGYAMREFILRKSLTNFIAIFYHLLKSFIRSKKKY